MISWVVAWLNVKRKRIAGVATAPAAAAVAHVHAAPAPAVAHVHHAAPAPAVAHVHHAAPAPPPGKSFYLMWAQRLGPEQEHKSRPT